MITLITESIDYSAKALTTYRSLGKVYFGPKPRKDANILVLRLAYKIDASWTDKMPNLKIIATPTTGLNHVDLKEAARRGIRVISLRGRTSFLKYIPSTAEETMALIFALVRKIPWAHEHVMSGGWNRDLFKGNQLIGKTLGLIGFGRLGKIVARYGKAFGMKILAHDPYLASRVFARYGAHRVALEQLLRSSDIVSLHVSLTEATKNLLREKHFRLMKPAAYFINTARGEIIDEAALLKALQKKWIAGAALDVIWNERGDGKHLKNNPLVAYAKTHRNLIIVPHIGGATYEAMAVTEEFIADQVKRYVHRR